MQDRDLRLQVEYEKAWLEGEINAILKEFELSNLWLQNAISVGGNAMPLSLEPDSSDQSLDINGLTQLP